MEAAGTSKGGWFRRKPRRERAHPYADEASTPAEKRADPRLVTLIWFLGSLGMAYGGWLLAARYGYVNNQFTAHAEWETWNGALLASSLVLLGVGTWMPLDRDSRHRVRMVGWIVFAAFWALTARDLFVREGADYVNAGAAIVFAVFGGNYFAYHEWLSLTRGVRNFATRFLAQVAVIAAGTYFLIAKVAPIRIWLIERVGAQTKASLDIFGFGDKLGLQFFIDKFDPWGPVLFHYPDTYCEANRSDPIGDYCAGLPADEQYVTTYAGGLGGATNSTADLSNLIDQILLYSPEDTRIIPVSIILACTAIQSIMLFVGLFMGTKAPLRQKLVWSIGTGAAIYVLNLLRNTFVIWAYGRGHGSFWIIHNVVAKIMTLVALLGIALLAFRRMPAFLDALGSVLDMPHRDGPIERVLKLGRRRPD